MLFIESMHSNSCETKVPVNSITPAHLHRTGDTDSGI